MKKLVLLFFGCVTALLADRTTYTLLTTTHPDKIAVQEIKEITSTGFDSCGHSIVLTHTVTNQRYLDLHEAVDIGVRYHNYAITSEALTKLCALGQKVDITDSICVICNGVHEAKFSRTLGRIFGGIFAACAIPVAFGPDIADFYEHRVHYTYFGHMETHTVYQSYPHKPSLTARLLGAAFFAGVGGLFWWLANREFKAEARQYIDVLIVLLNSPACYVSDCKQAREALMGARELLPDRERDIVSAYIQALSMPATVVATIPVTVTVAG